MMYHYLTKCIVLCGALCVGALHATWSAPTNVSALHQGNIRAKIAEDNNGNATIVWYNVLTNAIQASSKPFGGVWEAEQTLSQLPIVEQSGDVVNVGMDSYGNATAIWMSFGGGGYIIQSATKLFGEPWQAPETLPVASAYGTVVPQIAVDRNGNATAIWVSAETALVQASTKPFGGSWQEPFNLSLPGTISLFTSIAVDGNGNVTAIWLNNSGSSYLVQASTKTFGGTWQQNPDIIASNARGVFLKIAIGSDGTAVAVWVSTDLTIQASTKPLSGTWQATPDTLSGQNSSDPQVGVDGHGNATVVWMNERTTDALIQASTKPFGGSWQEIPNTLSLPGFISTLPQIAVDDSGNATSVWQATDGTHYTIQAVTKTFGSQWQSHPDALVTSEYTQTPQLAVDGSSNVTAIWNSFFDQSSVIQAATNAFGLAVRIIRPTSGPQKGGNTVTITGTNFVDVASVYFGSIPSPSFIVNSPTTITAVVPQGKGTVDVTIMTSSQSSPMTLADLYTYRRFKGKVKHHKNKLFMKTKWNKSVAAVTGYEIFARKKKIATIPAQNNAHATIRLHPRHIHHEISNKYRRYLQHKYKVRAIDADGTASAFTFVDIHR